MLEDFKEIFLPVILITILVVVLVIGLTIGLAYIVSVKEAKIYNQINNTNYSAWDFFWAENAIIQQNQSVKVLK